MTMKFSLTVTALGKDAQQRMPKLAQRFLFVLRSVEAFAPEVILFHTSQQQCGLLAFILGRMYSAGRLCSFCRYLADTCAGVALRWGSRLGTGSSRRLRADSRQS
jgi:hypothetical protein